MNIDEAIIVLDTLIDRFEIEMRNLSEELAMTTMGVIINRIQQQGLTGRKYSERKLPVYYFYKKALNPGGLALLEKHDKKALRAALRAEGTVRKNKKIDELEDGISYEEWRRANGLQTNHVDLTFTGRMWQNMSIIGTTRNGDNFVTIVGGIDREVKDKLIWNARRYGDFFVLTDKEKSEMTAVYKEKLKTVLNKYIP